MRPGPLDPQKIIATLLSSPAAGAAAGGLPGSLLGNVLVGKSGGKKLAKTAVKAGGLALVGGIAWQAWRQYQARQAGAGPSAPADRAALPAAFDLERQRGAALAVLRAMVAASRADGVIEPAGARPHPRSPAGGRSAAGRPAVRAGPVRTAAGP